MAETFADRLRRLREARKFSRYRLGKDTGLSDAYIKRLEEGTARRPGPDTIQRLAHVLEVPIADLFPAEHIIRPDLAGTGDMPVWLATTIQRLGRGLTEDDWRIVNSVLEGLAARHTVPPETFSYQAPEVPEDSDDEDESGTKQTA